TQWTRLRGDGSVAGVGCSALFGANATTALDDPVTLMDTTARTNFAALTYKYIASRLLKSPDIETVRLSEIHYSVGATTAAARGTVQKELQYIAGRVARGSAPRALDGVLIMTKV